MILRQSESESINSGKYEVVNDRIRLYGNTNCPLLLTYWTVPTFISFPNKDIETDLSGEILSTAGNSVLLDNGTIKNIVTGDTLGTIELDDADYILGNGHVVRITENNITYINYDGVEIRSIATTGTVHTFLDCNYNVIYQEYNESKWSAPKLINKQLLSDTEYETEGYPMFIGSFDDIWLFWNQTNATLNAYDANIDYIVLETKLPFTPNAIMPAEDFNMSPAFTITDTNDNVYFMTLKEEEDLYSIEYELIDKPVLLLGLLKYGPLVSNGTTSKLLSCIPDTELNFPNDLYFSLLACDLALRYAMKMNANTDGLNNLYMNMQSTFMNTLSQDSGYTRIRNVY